MIVSIWKTRTVYIVLSKILYSSIYGTAEQFMYYQNYGC